MKSAPNFVDNLFELSGVKGIVAPGGIVYLTGI